MLSSKKVGFLVVLLFIAWSIGIIYVFHSSVNYNPLKLPFEDKKVIQTLVPQGWSFFTKSPRSPQNFFFKKENSWQPISKAHLSKGFTFNRISRAQGVEFGLIQNKFRASAWTKCDGEIKNCLNGIPLLGPVQNPSPNPTLCDTVGIAQQKPLPWAWRDYRNTVTMESKTLKVEIICEAAR